MPGVRAALVELDTVWEDPAANRERIRRALPEGADLHVLPEMAFTGFTMGAAPDPEAEPFLRALARERRAAIAAGYVGPGPENRAVAVSAEGRVLVRYAKLHPFRPAGEPYRAGRTLPLFELGGFTAALFICYDLRFPEVFREAALRGADLFLVLANWPGRRIDHWRLLLRARAVENLAYVLGVNRTGADPHETYPSSSLAVDPWGTVLHEGAGLVELDPARPRRRRKEFPVLEDVRRDRYPFPGEMNV